MNDTAAHSRAPVHREGRLALVVFGVIEILIGLTLAAMAPLSILASFLATSVDLWVVVPSVVLYLAMASAFIALGIGVIRARRWACALSLSLGWVWLLTGICTVALVWLFTPTLWSDLALSSGLSRRVAEWVGVGINLFLVVTYLLLPGVFVFFFRSPRTIAACHRHDPNPGWAGRCPQRLLALAVAYALGGLSVLAMPAYGFIFPLFGFLVSGLAGAVLWTGVLLLAGVLTWGTCLRMAWAWRLAVIATVAAAASCAITFAVVTPESVFSATGLPAEQRFLIDDFWPSAPWIHVTFWLAVWGSLLGYLAAARPLFDFSASAEADAEDSFRRPGPVDGGSRSGGAAQGCAATLGGSAILVVLGPVVAAIRSWQAWRRGTSWKIDHDADVASADDGRAVARLGLRADIPIRNGGGFPSRLTDSVIRVAEALLRQGDTHFLIYRKPEENEPLLLPLGPRLQDLGERLLLVLGQTDLERRTALWLTLDARQPITDLVEPQAYDPEAEGEPQGLVTRSEVRWALTTSWTRLGPSTAYRVLLWVPGEAAPAVRSILDRLAT